MPMTRVMKGATAPEAMEETVAGKTRKMRSCLERKLKSSRMEGVGGFAVGCSKVCVEGVTGSLRVEVAGELGVESTEYSVDGRPMTDVMVG